jgi:putative methionine-R-sulfoxide reductase with GAF domain/GGDEF domain-containing protein
MSRPSHNQSTAPRLDLTSLSNALLAIHGAPDAAAIASEVITLLRTTAPDESVVFLRKDGRYFRPFRTLGAAISVHDHDIPTDGPLAHRMSTGVPIHTIDIRGRAIREMGGTSLYPLVHDGQLMGGLISSAPDSKRTHHRVLTMLVGHVAASLAGLEKPEAATPQASSDPLFAATSALIPAASLAVVLKRVLRTAAKMAGAEKATLMLLDAEGKELVVRSVRGMADQKLSKKICSGEIRTMRMPVAKSLPGQVVRTGRTKVIHNTPGGKASARRGQGSGSKLLVALNTSSGAIGVLSLSSSQPQERFDTAAPVVEQFAAAAALAIQRTRTYRRVARDPATGLFHARLMEAWLEDTLVRARHAERSVSMVAFGVNLLKGQPPSKRRLEAVGSALRRLAPDHLDLAGYEGKGRFIVALDAQDNTAAERLCKRLATELGTMYHGEAGWAFVTAELGRHESSRSLLRRCRVALDGALNGGPGIRFLNAPTA